MKNSSSLYYMYHNIIFYFTKHLHIKHFLESQAFTDKIQSATSRYKIKVKILWLNLCWISTSFWETSFFFKVNKYIWETFVHTPYWHENKNCMTQWFVVSLSFPVKFCPKKKLNLIIKPNKHCDSILTRRFPQHINQWHFSCYIHCSSEFGQIG